MAAAAIPPVIAKQFMQLVQLMTAERKYTKGCAKRKTSHSLHGRWPVDKSGVVPFDPPLRSTDGAPVDNAVSWLAFQISEFEGSKEDNVSTWIRRMDKMPQVLPIK